MTRRRRIVWVAAILVVAVLLVPAVAVAAPDSPSVTQGPNSALSWTNVRDSDGVPLSNYMFVTSDGEILKPLDTMLALVLQLTFTVWLVIITLAIWVIGFALSFGFLDLFADALLGAANLFAGQIATTIVLITAATLGAFFVSYFVVRGLYAKATMQVVTMIAVAVFGVIFLAHPLAEVLGTDGLLAKGRDVGVSIAAGLHGNSNPDPQNVVATMQASLADNFARKPLQVWNFGHVIDDQCGSAWSSAMMSGDSNHAKSVLRACDAAAYAAAEEPSFTQFGAGLVLFVCGLILVWFAVKLGLKVIRAAFNAVYHGFMSILGFAAGGYIYGPTQTFLIRNLVDTAFAAFGMAAYTIFLAIYVLVLGDVFRQARGQVITVLVLGAIVMLVASRQIDNLRASLESGGEWVANRFAVATQAFTGGAAGGGGAAPGIGAGSHAMSGLTTLAVLGALNTINANPLVAWAAGKVDSPLSPYARGKKLKMLQDVALAENNWPFDFQRWHALTRDSALDAAQTGIQRHRDTRPPSVQYAWAVDRMGDRGIPQTLQDAALKDLGLTDRSVHGLFRAQAIINSTLTREDVQFLPSWKTIAALEAVRNHPAEDMISPEGIFIRGVGHDDAEKIAASAEVVAFNFARHAPKVQPTNLQPLDRAFIAKVEQYWDSEDDMRRYVSNDEWNNANRATRNALGQKLAWQAYEAAAVYNDSPTMANREQLDIVLRRIKNTVAGQFDQRKDPWTK
jgi:hypothetical protein